MNDRIEKTFRIVIDLTVRETDEALPPVEEIEELVKSFGLDGFRQAMHSAIDAEDDTEDAIALVSVTDHIAPAKRN